VWWEKGQRVVEREEKKERWDRGWGKAEKENRDVRRRGERNGLERVM
jgi:hypothetical protein